MASDKEIDEMIAKLEKMKSGKKKSYSEQRLETLRAIPESEKSVDEKMEEDRLWSAEIERKQDEAFAEAWKNVSGWKKLD